MPKRIQDRYEPQWCAIYFAELNLSMEYYINFVSVG